MPTRRLPSGLFVVETQRPRRIPESLRDKLRAITIPSYVPGDQADHDPNGRHGPEYTRACRRWKDRNQAKPIGGPAPAYERRGPAHDDDELDEVAAHQQRDPRWWEALEDIETSRTGVTD